MSRNPRARFVAEDTRRPRLALIRGLSQGTFFARYAQGARKMARELSLRLTVKDAPGDQMEAALRWAVERGVEGVVLSSGDLGPIRAAVDFALEQGVQVVGFDMVGEHPQVPALEQDDMWIGFLLGRTLAGDCDGCGQVLYLNPGGYAPLEKRDRGWQAYKWRYPDLHEIARAGAVTEDPEGDAEATVTALLEAHPETTVIVAVWDELARGAVRAVLKAGRQDRVCVYSVDVSDEDIRMMTSPGSPWVATVATDASNIGRVAVRAVVALMAGEKVQRHLLVEPQLVTQEFLRTNDITDLDGLVEALPTLGESPLLWSDWMEARLACTGHQKPMATLAPEQLISLSRKLRETEGALREEHRRKDEFLAVLSHELRNPLAAIRTALYLAAHVAPGSERAQRSLAVIDRQSAQLARLVDDLLDVTRIARGKTLMHRERTELGALVARTVEDHREGLGGLQLDVRLTAEPLWVLADSVRVAQIVGNLLGNAAKFTPAGGRVEVSLERRGRMAVLTVRDNGVGIEPAVLDDLFLPFTQAAQSIERTQGGLGLGLALVKGLAELHGGTVAADSAGPGQGAELTVCLPLLDRAEAAAPSEQPRA